MRFSEKRMKEILGRDIQVSDTVNNRLQDTYKMLKAGQKQGHRQPHRKRFSYAAAAIAAAICLAIPGGVYAAANLDFFDAMFGNNTKKSTPVIETEVDTGKMNEDGTPKMAPVTLPSHEFISVDPQEAQDLTGGGCLDKPVEKQLGDHTLRIENMVYDQNGAVIYFTLERPGGVTMLIGNDDTNVRKGAYFSEDRQYHFSFDTTSDDIFGCYNIYVDMEKSTADKLYCTDYILWSEPLPEGVFPKLNITKYPGPVSTAENMTEEEAEAFYGQFETKETTLTDKKPIPVQKIDLGEKGCVVYSPISIGIDLSKGLGLSEADSYDPVNLARMEIKYKDGSSYVVYDDAKHVDNTGYQLGGVSESWMMSAFNRLVDVNEIQEILANDVTFPVK